MYKYYWLMASIPAGVISGVLCGLWSLAIGNEFYSNFTGAFVGQSIGCFILHIPHQYFIKHR